MDYTETQFGKKLTDTTETTNREFEHKPEGMPDGHYEVLIQTLAELEDCRERIKHYREWERDVVERVYELLPSKKVVIPPFGVIEKSLSQNRKWDNEQMFSTLLARARDHRLMDKETGELLESEGQAVRRVIEECAYISYWRITPLIEKYGIDPDEFYETTSRRQSVRIIK